MLKHIRTFLNKPKPTIFDLSIGIFAFIPWIRGDKNRAIFIVFYTAFLVAWSLSLKPKRQYKSLPLALLTIWSLINVFIHAFVIYPTSWTSLYPNYYLMLEGFLYVFFAVLFIRTVAVYSTNIRFIYFLLPIGIYPWISDLQRTGNLTTIGALCVSAFIYLMFKRWRLAMPLLLAGATAVAMHWKWVCLKFYCRPKVWQQLFINMFYRPVRYEGKNIVDAGINFSPFLERFVDSYIGKALKPWLATIFGRGFGQHLDPNYVWVVKNKYGWLYRQSDYGAIGNDLGPIALILVIWFIVESIKKIGVTPYAILFWMTILVCTFQVTMYIPYKAGIYLMVIALSITEGAKRRRKV